MYVYIFIVNLSCSNLSFSIGTTDQSVSLYFLCITSYLTCTFLQIARDHSFPRNADFRAKLRNLPVSVEFLCFHEFWGIQYWQVLGVQAAIHDFTMKYMTATRAVMGGILKILSWAYLKYCHLIWQTDCICQLQLPATNTVHLVGFRGHRKSVAICGKFATENCGPYRSPWSQDN